MPSIRHKPSSLLGKCIGSAALFAAGLPVVKADACLPDARAALCQQAVQAAERSDYALYFDAYLGSHFLLSPLTGLSDDAPPLITPVELRLPGFTGQLGNPDVAIDGKTVVFSAFVREDWNLYQGQLDIVNGAIVGITPLIAEQGVQEEDPRMSWDGTRVVYKCGGNVCVVQLDHPGFRLLQVDDVCELYGPVFDPSGQHLAYTKRCGDETGDRVVLYDMASRNELKLGSPALGPDRFPHFLANGTFVYSHFDNSDGTASLWSYDPQTPDQAPALLHDQTVSDDDNYVHKLNAEYIFFSGFDLGTDRYDLYVYRHGSGDARQLSDSQSIIGAVVFSADLPGLIDSGSEG